MVDFMAPLREKDRGKGRFKRIPMEEITDGDEAEKDDFWES